MTVVAVQRWGRDCCFFHCCTSPYQRNEATKLSNFQQQHSKSSDHTANVSATAQRQEQQCRQHISNHTASTTTAGRGPCCDRFPLGEDDIHVAFSTDCTNYQAWQAVVLFHSAIISGHKGPITQLVSFRQTTVPWFMKQRESTYARAPRNTPQITRGPGLASFFSTVMGWTPNQNVYFNSILSEDRSSKECWSLNRPGWCQSLSVVTLFRLPGTSDLLFGGYDRIRNDPDPSRPARS